MAYLPIVLGIRFILEMAGLFSLGFWGWTFGPGFLRYLLAILLPGLAAIAWVTFRAIEPVEPKPIPRLVTGRVRLGLELAFFGLATAAWFHSGQTVGGILFGLGVCFLHLASIDRIGWLLKPG